MIALPLIVTAISAVCAAVIARDAVRRPRPDKVIWAIAFAMFALAAGAEAAGHAFGWTELTARTYYATGPALVVAFLAIGQLYLLFPNAMRRFGVGVTILVTALWLTLVVSAPIDQARLAADGWDAIERNSVMVTVTMLINIVGTLIIVGGTGFSAFTFWRRRIMRNRMIGVLWIGGGTIVVALGGSLARLGQPEFLYIAMAIGIAMIFGGVLWTRRPETVAVEAPPPPTALELTPGTGGEELTGVPLDSDAAPTTPHALPGLAYIEGQILTLTDAEVDRTMAEWSVPREPEVVFSRSEAQAAWRFRLCLTEAGRRLFDRHAVPARRQVVSFYNDVVGESSTPEDFRVTTSSAIPSSELTANAPE